jgi:hypothetical protein
VLKIYLLLMGVVIIILPILLCLFEGARNPDAKFYITKTKYINIGIKNPKTRIIILTFVLICILFRLLSTLLWD